jgi:putative ABC transport system permease protein
MNNFLLVLLRMLRREKLYAAINIAGLSLGVACCLILGLFLHSELTYDHHYPKYRNIYRLVNEFTTGGANDKFAVTSRVIGPMLKAEYPADVLAYVRFQQNANRGGVAIRHGDDVFYWEHSYFVSPNVFELFPPKVIYGDPKTALQEQGNIAVSETFARKYFGNANPMGETIVTDGGVAQKINLVFADQPENTHLKYDILWSENLPFLRDSDNPSQRRQQLFGIGNITYLLMAPGFKPSDWKRINDDFWKKNMEEIGKAFKAEWHSWLQPLADVHLQTEVQDNLPTGNRIYLYGCAAVALFILLVACINYMNLATARATRRARSVGIRKILGASRASLAIQFLAEAVLFSLISMVLGVVIVEVVLTLTPINSLMGNQVQFDLLKEPTLGLWLVALSVAMGLLAGAYPAFYLSSWAPLTALTGKQTGGKASLRLREALVLLQFTISAAVIACTLLMGAQMRYVANRSLGFEKEHRLIVTMRGAPTIDKHDTIKSELLKDSHILGVAIAAAPPADAGTPVNLAQVEQEDGKTEPTQLNNFPIGEGYVEVMGIKILQGRDLSKRLLTDVGTNVLVNEAMVRKMGWTNPLGKRMVVRGEAGRVIGVMRDFNFKSLHTKIEPLAVYPLNMDLSGMPDINKPFIQNYLVIKISSEDISGTLGKIERVMADADAKHPFEYTFLDDALDKLYKSENQLLKLIAIFAAICIFIACLGLFGLASFTTEMRTREIGTRKVLGATTWQIIGLLARPIMVLVLVASVLAAVISFFAIDEWLSTFAYKAGINPLIFLVAAIVAAVVAFVTVAAQSWRTASADPVNALRHV